MEWAHAAQFAFVVPISKVPNPPSLNASVDAIVHEKAIAYPVDSRLLESVHHKVICAAKPVGIQLK